MCRIAGIVSKKIQAGELEKKVKAMCTSLQHGGPDDEGIFADESTGLAFGHRRLSIIDLTTNGHQPMADTNKRVWITFNGEIYNYLQLKDELLNAGFSFYSGTDTEVIINAYLHWDIHAFSKLRGMFAFALYDTIQNITYLVRDSAGIKPLYYCANDSELYFASEVRALKAADIATEEAGAWPVMLLAFGNIPEPYTTLKDVYSLPKGKFLKWDHNTGSHTIEQYHSWEKENFIKNEADARREVQYGLQRAVLGQLIADAPIGVFLSGGIDSGILSLLANGHKEQRLKTVSIYFNEKAYDEQSYQKTLLDNLNSEKYMHLVKQQDFEDAFPHIISAMDMPTTDGINSWFISKYAHQDGLKAVLSGIGGDELFGGYPSFKRMGALSFLRKLPAGFFGAAKLFSTDKYRRFGFLQHQQSQADYLFLRGLFAVDDIARILNADIHEINEILFGEELTATSEVYDHERAAWFETNFYMQNQLLRDTDVMSMNHGLEVRVPFLDEDFVSMVKSIAPEIRFDKKQHKGLLIKSFSDLLPESVWNRPKMGFSFPLQEWMNNYQEINDPNLYKGRVAKDAVVKFNNGQMHWSKIFALYQVQLHA